MILCTYKGVVGFFFFGTSPQIEINVILAVKVSGRNELAR